MAKDPTSSEPFVSQQDRPNLTADTPVSELRVRDLHQILSGATLNKFIEKIHFDKVQKDIEKIHPDKYHKDFKEIDTKFAKDLVDTIVKNVGEGLPDPTKIGGDPISQLQNSVNQLTSEVARLKAKVGQ
jgi:hypothetical protein